MALSAFSLVCLAHPTGLRVPSRLPAHVLRHARTRALCDTATTGYHVPVLCAAVAEWLITDKAGIYVDGTLGGGGHSAALLEVLRLQIDA